MSSDVPETASQCTTECDGSWTTNVVWKSFEIQEWERFGRLQREKFRAASQEGKSNIQPYTFEQHVKDRLATLDNDIEALKAKIATKEQHSVEESEVSLSEVSSVSCAKDIETATRVRMYPLTPRIIGVVTWTKSLDLDVEFIARGEFLIGADLLKEL